MGEFLHNIMEQRGKTPEDIATLLDTSVEKIYGVFAGEVFINPFSNVEKLCDYLDITVAELVGESAEVNQCPYCEAETNDFVEINQYADYCGIEVSLNRQGLLRVRTYNDERDSFDSQDVVEIKYCPLWGRPFKKG